MSEVPSKKKWGKHREIRTSVGLTCIKRDKTGQCSEVHVVIARAGERRKEAT